MIRFTLFGIPVEIQPWFWLTLAFLSGRLDSPAGIDLFYALIFILAATISILVHELGHALTGLHQGGGRANIVLWGFGGLAYNQGGRFTKAGRFWMIAAGPGAGFILGLLVFLGTVVGFGLAEAVSFAKGALFNDWRAISMETLEFFSAREPLYYLIKDFLWINFWWNVLNLLPILPLDGGQIADLWVKPQRRMHQISLVMAIIVAVGSFALTRSFFTPILFGFLAFQSYQALKQDRWQ